MSRSHSTIGTIGHTSSVDHQEHEEEHGHGHSKLKPYAKVLIVMECLWSLYSYNYRYLLGYQGSFHTGIEVNTWVYYGNIGIFAASLLAVVIAIITESYFSKYTVFVIGFLLSIISSGILFFVSVFQTGQYTQVLNTIALLWGLLFIVVEPLRVAVFFDQLPNHMDPHKCAHVFLFYQEMKTFGSVMYVFFYKFLGSGYSLGKTPLSLAIVYFAIPIFYIIVVLGYWKASNPGEFAYSVGIESASCFLRGMYLVIVKRMKFEGHWLDTARDQYDTKTVRNTKTMCSLSFIYTTLITYGMVQTLSKINWTDQAQSLKENLTLKYYYQDITQVFFALTIVFLPILEYLILPQIYKRRANGKPFTELQKIGVTVFVTGAAFLVTAILQVQIEKHATIHPIGNRAQVRIFNVQNETVWITSNWVFERTNISATKFVQAWNLQSHTPSLYTINVQSAPDPHARISYTNFMGTEPGKSISYLIGVEALQRVLDYDPIALGPQGTNKPDLVRLYVVNYYVLLDDHAHEPFLIPGDEIQFRILYDDPALCTKGFNLTVKIPQPVGREIFQLCAGEYEIVCPPKRAGVESDRTCMPEERVTLQRGGVYALIPHVKEGPIPSASGPQDSKQYYKFTSFTMSNPAYYSIYLMLPQVVLQAFAIALGKIPINVFLFKESPRELRVTSLALYNFSQDGSSIIFAIFNNVFNFRVDSFQLVLVTGIHMVFCFFFTYAALKHQKFPEDDGIRRRRAVIHDEGPG